MIFQVLLFQEGNQWVAQGLEMDIVVQSSSAKEATEAFILAFLSNLILHEELKQVVYRENIPPAPDIYWKQIMKATPYLDRDPVIEVGNLRVFISFKFYLLEKK